MLRIYQRTGLRLAGRLIYLSPSVSCQTSFHLFNDKARHIIRLYTTDKGSDTTRNTSEGNVVNAEPRKKSKAKFWAITLLLSSGASAALVWRQMNEKSKAEDRQLNTVGEPVSTHALIRKQEEEKDSKIVANENIDEEEDRVAGSEKMLLAALQSATDMVKTASNAKYETIAAINEHTKLLKGVVDAGDSGDWSVVTNALDVVNQKSGNDAKEEANARNYLDSVYKIIEEVERTESFRNSMLLGSVRQTVDKLSRQLDELNIFVKKARNEGRILSEYKELVEKSRKEFAQELKSVLPNIDLHAQESKLSEDELNALIAHAHLQIDRLRKQLAEQQVREEQNIMHALEDQKATQNKLSEEEMQLKMQVLKEESKAETEKILEGNRKIWESEMEEKLQRLTAVHVEHIEEVVRAQRNLFEIEQKQRIEEAVADERAQHSIQMCAAQGKLDAIESALNSRVVQDAENRREKQVWIACQNLANSVLHGRRGGNTIDARRKPLAIELQVIKEANSNDSFVTSLVGALPDETIYNGVYTEEDLKTRFDKLYKACRRVAKMKEDSVSIFQYGLSYVQNALSFDIPGDYLKTDKFDPLSLDTYEILSRAKYFVDHEDLMSAVRMIQLLTGPARQIARDWISDTRKHLEARLIAEILVTHAAVTNFTTFY